MLALISEERPMEDRMYSKVAADETHLCKVKTVAQMSLAMLRLCRCRATFEPKNSSILLVRCLSSTCARQQDMGAAFKVDGWSGT